MTDPRTPILELRGVNKSFGAVQVLHGVDLQIHPGQVTALVGDNGAGKSTLVKCVAGIHGIDSGEYIFEGREVHVSSPRDAAGLGIEIVYQDLALCDNLDIVQNMFLGREPKAGLGLGVLLISHNMNDVKEVSDRISALYLGRVAADVAAADVSTGQIVELITTGRSGEHGLAKSVAEKSA